MALDVLTGKLIASKFCQEHASVVFVDFLHQVVDSNLEVELRVICDNLATPKQLNVKDWLAKIARMAMHFTPTNCSWLNMEEIFRGIITRPHPK